MSEDSLPSIVLGRGLATIAGQLDTEETSVAERPYRMLDWLGLGQSPESQGVSTKMSDSKGTQSTQTSKPRAPALRELRRANPGLRNFIALLEREVLVERVDGDTLYCRLFPVTDKGIESGDIEFTEFNLDDIGTPSERELAVPGAYFYWTLGRARNEFGQETKQSLLRARRMVIVGESTPLSQELVSKLQFLTNTE